MGEVEGDIMGMIIIPPLVLIYSRYIHLNIIWILPIDHEACHSIRSIMKFNDLHFNPNHIFPYGQSTRYIPTKYV